MLSSFSSYHGVYIEITKSEHHHGGKGWEFGTCLWSPTKNRGGSDRYSLMREPIKGDLVLHFYHETWDDGVTDTRLCGYSFVSKPYSVVEHDPPSPGAWEGLAPHYRIELIGYTLFPVALPFSVIKDEYSDEILNEILEDKPRFFLFNTYGDTIRTVQGIYIARCTNKLYDLFLRALSIQVNVNPKVATIPETHTEYTEARRLAHERYFFARNPKLVKDAKKAHGYKCQACGFDFSLHYGSLGDGYIEAHHKRPLSERPESEWTNELVTKVEDIDVLCANCHRMIHRHKSALTLEELVDILQSQKVAAQIGRTA